MTREFDDRTLLPRPIANDVGFLQIAATLLRGRVIIVISTVACSLIALAMVLLAPPIYRAEVVITPVRASGSAGQLGELASQFGGLSALANIGLSGVGAEKEVTLATLTSRDFLARFITERNLMPVLFASRWDAEHNAWLTSRWSRQPTLNEAVQYFRRRVLDVTEDRRTGMVRVTIEWRDRVSAAEWANTLIARLNAAARAGTVSEAERSLSYLRQELLKTDIVEAQRAVSHLMESQMERIMLANARDEFAVKTIDPARVPDAEDYVHPRPALDVFLGLLGGLVLGAVVVLVRSVRWVELFG